MLAQPMLTRSVHVAAALLAVLSLLPCLNVPLFHNRSQRPNGSIVSITSYPRRTRSASGTCMIVPTSIQTWPLTLQACQALTPRLAVRRRLDKGPGPMSSRHICSMNSGLRRHASTFSLSQRQRRLLIHFPKTTTSPLVVRVLVVQPARSESLRTYRKEVTRNSTNSRTPSAGHAVVIRFVLVRTWDARLKLRLLPRMLSAALFLPRVGHCLLWTIFLTIFWEHPVLQA